MKSIIKSMAFLWVFLPLLTLPIYSCHIWSANYRMDHAAIQSFGILAWYFWYIDDIFLLFPGHIGRELVDVYLGFYSKLHPNIKISWTVSQDSADFLDVSIFTGPRFASTGCLDIRTHQKTLNRYLYIPGESFHTRAMFKSLIKAELICYIRTCSSEADFMEICNRFWFRLRAHGHGAQSMSGTFASVSYTNRLEYLFKSNHHHHQSVSPLVFVIPHTSFDMIYNWRPLLTLIYATMLEEDKRFHYDYNTSSRFIGISSQLPRIAL